MGHPPERACGAEKTECDQIFWLPAFAQKKTDQRQQQNDEQIKIVREVIIPETITVQELANRMATRGVDWKAAGERALMFAQQLVNGLFLGAVYALFAVGYTLVFGVLDILNLAHAAIYMIAAFTA